jgi:hypothetical protein
MEQRHERRIQEGTEASEKRELMGQIISNVK